MTFTAKDIWRTIGNLEADSRSQLAKLHDLRMMLAACDLPADHVGPKCLVCGVEKHDDDQLADHMANVHGLDEYAPAA